MSEWRELLAVESRGLHPKGDKRRIGFPRSPGSKFHNIVRGIRHAIPANLWLDHVLDCIVPVETGTSISKRGEFDCLSNHILGLYAFDLDGAERNCPAHVLLYLDFESHGIYS